MIKILNAIATQLSAVLVPGEVVEHDDHRITFYRETGGKITGRLVSKNNSDVLTAYIFDQTRADGSTTGIRLLSVTVNGESAFMQGYHAHDLCSNNLETFVQRLSSQNESGIIQHTCSHKSLTSSATQ